ncbi:MAG TPA: apolipoprotein N-acyltransferase [Candidatus Binatia bacterium]|nr:apolipoprotein N-acyltransferase [Candidatus Binatia bacterium]
MRRIRPRAWIFACASGVLQVLIFPKFSIYLLGWVALAPLIYAILKCREQDVMLVLADGGQFLAPATAWQGFLLGYASGIIWYLGSCYWVYHVMHLYGGLGVATSVGLLVAFALYLALYHGLFGLLLALIAARRNGFSLRALVFTPFLWVAVELARTWITGFPWDLLGTTQIDNIPLCGIARVTGVYGISFEIALVNTAVAAAFLVPYARRKVLLTASLAAAIALHAGKLEKPEALPSTQGVTLVQSDIPILDARAWDLDYLEHTLRELSDLSVRPRAEHAGTPGLIIWPESPAPFWVTDLHVRSTLANVARRTDSSIIAGTLGIQHAGELARQPVIYNSASVIARNGAWTLEYDKVHLVPFGEYVPFAEFLFFARKLTREIGTFGRGTRREPLEVDGTHLGIFICYESIFPDEVRQFARHGAEVFVNISNDGWYGNTSAPLQHLNMARMRAVENNRWLLRDTNTGITAIIDPYGRITAEAPSWQRTGLQGAYDVEETTTFYTRHGDWFPLLCAIITLLGLMLRYFSPPTGDVELTTETQRHREEGSS